MPPKTDVSDIVDRRNESRRYMQANYWEEWEDVYRAVKCKTKPIMVKNRQGSEVEDTSRTNVCMPELSLIRRRKLARLTANPPEINYLTPQGDNDPVSMKLTAAAFQQFDRSGEATEHRRVVDSGLTFGRGISKLKWDTIEIIRRVRKSLTSGDFGDVKSLMDFQGKSEEETNEATSQYGTELNDDLIKQLILNSGSDEVRGQQITKKYEGPIVTNVFVGDFFDEPGCRTLAESGWAIENYSESDIWLQKMCRKKYLDMDGQEQPLFSVEAATELLDMPSPNVANTQQPFDLRTRLRSVALNQTMPLHPSRLIPGKRFDILESHQRDEYGQMWITWVGNEKVKLGSMPYPWDLYGKSVYTEFVPLPDFLNAVGDSTPRLLRWLHLLHNATVGQRKDLVNAILRPLMGKRIGSDIPDEAIERKLFRVIEMQKEGDIWPIAENASLGTVLSAANEEEKQIIEMLALAEPNMTVTQSGSETNPMAGKTATTAILAAKSADALTQFEMDQLLLYLKELGEKKLWMNQQALEEPMTLEPGYAGKVQGLSERYGKTSGLTLDPMEIQEDIQVEPAAGSMLAVDDELKQNAAMKFYTFAAQDPHNFNTNYAAQFLASTIRGVDPAKAVNPPGPPPNPPPKVNIAVAVKWPELPPETQAEVIQGIGGTVTPALMQHLEEQQAMEDVVKVSEAADGASNLAAPPDHVLQQQQMAQDARDSEGNLQVKSDANKLKAQTKKVDNKVAKS